MSRCSVQAIAMRPGRSRGSFRHWRNGRCGHRQFRPDDTPEPRVWCCGALHHGAVIVPAARRPQMMRELAGAPLAEAGSGGHLAIAQLVDSRFNRCKSALRVTESWALGLPVIASDVTPFCDVIEHGVTGMLCRSAEDWTKALTELEHDGAMRMELARNGRLKARGLVITKHAQEWEAAYHSV